MKTALRSMLPTVVATCLLYPAVRADNLHLELNELAVEIQKVVEKENQTAIAVGEFTGSRDFPSSAGPEIQRALTEALKRLKISVTEKANLEIKGDYRHVNDQESKETVIKINARILDSKNEEIAKLRARAVHGNVELTKYLGVPATLDPGKDREQRNYEVRRAIEAPKAFVYGTRVSAAKNSPFEVELLVSPTEKTEGIPRKAVLEHGLAFVPIQRAEYYQLRLINKSNYEVAATVTIDGLDLFVFSDDKDPKTGLPQRKPTGEPLFSHRIISPARGGKEGSTLVKGWFRTPAVADSFVVTEYAKTAAARLQNTSKLGTITVTFAASWENDAGRPPDETGGDKGGGDGTGQGPPVGQNLKVVKRTIGAIRAVVPIRYAK